MRNLTLVCWAIVAQLILPATATAQSIAIDSIPAYGTLGSVTGSVAGVDFATHHVATFIHIEGSGWWTKPTSGTPTVVIDGGGSFSANVGTGGPGSLDSRAVVFCVALLHESVAPDLAIGAVRIPASLSPLDLDCEVRYGRTISFAGFEWGVKEAPIPVGPGSNRFSDRAEDVFVDQDGLHLRVAFHDGNWWSTEVVLLESLGYGTYVFQTDSPLDELDANVTFGLFTWDLWGDETTVPGSPNREIDFEDSRWANALDPMNAQMVVQPYFTPGNLSRYTLPDPSPDERLTRFFTWELGSLEFIALTGHHAPDDFEPADVIHQFVYTHDPGSGHYVPTAGRESLHLNLWLNNVAVGGAPPPAPANGAAVEVVITDVTFVPEPDSWIALLSGVATLAGLRRGCAGSRRSQAES